MRAQVAASWERSTAAGVPPELTEPTITFDSVDLQQHRETHPLAKVFPLLDEVLGQAVRDCGAVMAIADCEGTLLWVSGGSQSLRHVERIGFVEGSNWDERLAGTNAPGLCLATGQPATVTRDEHFRVSVRSWSCAAAPIYDPGSSRILGVLDITGGDQVVVPQTMAMVRAGARLAESELAAVAVSRHVEQSNSGIDLILEILGRNEAALTLNDDYGLASRVPLSRRHSEIVALLATTPSGLTGDELGVLLYEDDGASSTLRAELNRLRVVLGGDLLASRPYRLCRDVTGDWLAVEGQIAAGDVRGAMRQYSGPLLPRSSAPGVVQIREELEAKLRRAVLASGEADLMSTWTRSSWGRDDYEMWLTQRQIVPPRSPMRALIDGHIDRLDRVFGGTPVQSIKSPAHTFKAAREERLRHGRRD